MKTIIRAAAFALLAAFPAGAEEMAGSAPTAPVITNDDQLFKDFGGKAGLVAIMDDFMVNLLADPRTKPFFENADQARIKMLLVEQFCVILNGGCTYTGRSMQEAHAGMDVKEDSFLALVENLQKSMTKFDVPFTSQNKLLAALAPQHRDIVTK